MQFKEYPEVNSVGGSELLLCADASTGETKTVPTSKLRDYAIGNLFRVKRVTYNIGTLNAGEYWVRSSEDAQADFPAIPGWTRELRIQRINGTGSASVVAHSHGFSMYAYAIKDCSDLELTVLCQWTRDDVVIYEADETIFAPKDS